MRTHPVNRQCIMLRCSARIFLEVLKILGFREKLALPCVIYIRKFLLFVFSFDLIFVLKDRLHGIKSWKIAPQQKCTVYIA